MQEEDKRYLLALAGYQEAEGDHGRRIKYLREQRSARDANSRSTGALTQSSRRTVYSSPTMRQRFMKP